MNRGFCSRVDVDFIITTGVDCRGNGSRFAVVNSCTRRRNLRKQHRKKKCRNWDSNLRPFACQVNTVLTELHTA